MLLVSDIMSRDVFTVEQDASVESTSWALNAELVGGAPVLDKSGTIVGVISKTDIVDHEKLHGTPHTTKVSEVMTRKVYCVASDDRAIDAVKLMAEKSVHRVIVVDGFGPPTGIVTAMDVLRALAAGKKLDDD